MAGLTPILAGAAMPNANQAGGLGVGPVVFVCVSVVIIWLAAWYVSK